MKFKRVFSGLICILFVITLFGCNSKEQTHKQKNFTKIAEIEKDSRVFEVNYDRVDYDAGDKFWADNNDNWGGGCTAVTKEFSDGHRVVGRNMDLNIADKPAYIVRTNASEDRYKTVGLAFTFRDYAPYYGEVKEKGISDEFKNILPFLCDDVMNDKGLHIEVNMRHAECDFAGNDQFSLKETNPDGERRVHMFELPRYIAEHCKTVAEAKEYIKTLDIYSKADYWNYCFIISDSTETGETHAALLEFSEIGFLGKVYNTYVADDEKVLAVNWIDEEDLSKIDWIGIGQTNKEKYCKIHAIAQANFYLNWWAYQREDMKSGEGRFMTVQSLIDGVDNTSQMYDLMRRISYSWFYTDYDNCKKYHFDPRSENLGEFQGGTYDFLFDEDYEDVIKELFNASNAEIRSMTRKQKEEKGGIWESTFTEVVDVTAQTIEVRFFENEALRFKVTMDGIEHLPELEAPVFSELPPYDYLEN